MQYKVKIRGIAPLIMHNGAAGLDTRSPAKLEIAEITSKKGKNRTEADDQRLFFLECQVSLWLDEKGSPTIPPAAVRANIEKSARKLKQGPQVREGLIVISTEFEWDKSLGTTAEELGKSAQFHAVVVVQRSRMLRTRAKFDKWALSFVIDADDELVDTTQLMQWLDIGGRRMGLGDWRPEKSGQYGRFEVEDIKEIK